MSETIKVCRVCGYVVRKCLGHTGLRAPYASPMDRHESVSDAEYTDLTRAYERNYDRWQKREGAANRRGGKGSGA
jgi:hypothetical protein